MTLNRDVIGHQWSTCQMMVIPFQVYQTCEPRVALGNFCEESMLVNYIYGGTAQGSRKFTAICNWWKIVPYATVCPIQNANFKQQIFLFILISWLLKYTKLRIYHLKYLLCNILLCLWPYKIRTYLNATICLFCYANSRQLFWIIFNIMNSFKCG